MEISQGIQLIQEQKIIYLLSLLSVAMIIDFISGVYAAKLHKEITSKRGINGIIRKVASMILLVFFLPVSLIIPGQTGIALLSVLYLGYLFMEIQSILENYQKIGIDTHYLQKILTKLKEKVNLDEKDD
ncbi:MAG: phage holin family protein [Enterococcus sp.]|uniref:Phage holin family protein n=1 Tax=Enterococcus aquimarinus TaxID=328396 RepID=A0A9E3ZTL0_9ENTE|nr:phage holin family protein [Enterococcus sp.]MBP8692601.1 phage holin family protein [Enterococcus sp.]MBP9639264.1 phage holin family protein [Enterococcus sp.]MCC9273444.1 phage holin family protein [Enterococcus aquimarinus]